MKNNLLFALVIGALPLVALAQDFVSIPQGQFQSSLVGMDEQVIPAFEIMRQPVLVEQFQQFIHDHPQWSAAAISPLFATQAYLSHPSTATKVQVSVSWFAAEAFCQTQQARLPTWIEWEYVASANASTRDARSELIWQQQWLQDGTRHAPIALPNIYGVEDLHGAHWEWVEDYAGLMPAANRGAEKTAQPTFCGGSASLLARPQEYATYSRLAVLASLSPQSSLDNLGFRCARSL